MQRIYRLIQTLLGFQLLQFSIISWPCIFYLKSPLVYPMTQVWMLFAPVRDYGPFFVFIAETQYI